MDADKRELGELGGGLFALITSHANRQCEENRYAWVEWTIATVVLFGCRPALQK